MLVLSFCSGKISDRMFDVVNSCSTRGLHSTTRCSTTLGHTLIAQVALRGNLSTNNHSRPHCSHSQTLGSNLEKQSDCKVEFGDWMNISTIGGRFYKGDLFI